MAFWSETLSVVYEVIMNLLLVLGLILLVIALATLFYPRFKRKKMNNSEIKTNVVRENTNKIDAKKLETEKIQIEKGEEIKGIEENDEITILKQQKESDQKKSEEKIT